MRKERLQHEDSMWKYAKKRGNCSIACPAIRGLRIAYPTETSNAEPTPIWNKSPPPYVLPLYMMIQSTIIDIFMVTYKRDANIITPRSIYRCPAFCKISWSCEVPNRKDKASCKRLRYIFHSQLPSLTPSRIKDTPGTAWAETFIGCSPRQVHHHPSLQREMPPYHEFQDAKLHFIFNMRNNFGK